MSKRGIQKSNVTFNKDHTGKFGAHKPCMPTVKCVCGCEILVVPDLKAMNRAIKNHMVEHKKDNERLKLTDFLTEQVLIVAANCFSTVN